MPYEKKTSYKKFNGKGKTTLNREPLTMNQGRPEPRRRRLAPLMAEDAKATASIHELTEDAEYKEYVQSKQIYRSGTSIGANVRESKHAQSDADFLSKMSIAYKEADETDYWLNLLHDNGYLDDKQFEPLENDITRILKILTSIVKTVRIKLGMEKSLTMNH